MAKRKIDELYDIVETNKITLDDMNLSIPSLSVLYNEDCYIAVNHSKIKNSIDEKEKLAHELGHCIKRAFYNEYSKLDLIEKHEYRANYWAVENLLPYYRLNAALHIYNNIWEVAEAVEQSIEFVKMAVEIYNRKGLLWKIL